MDKLKKTAIITLFFVGLIGQISFAQESEKIFVGEKIQFKSSILGHDRELLIYLPVGYQNTEKTYPVVYATDAELTFLLTSSLFETLSQQGFTPEVIVVGIKNRGENERYLDFAPKIQGRPQSGRADLFIDFFEKELFPYIEKNYRTQPFRILQGHSFLGMFAAYVFIKRPDLFNAYVISSPDLRWIKDSISNENLKKLSNPNFMYISRGSHERPSQEIDTFVELIKKMDKLNHLYIENKGENHQSNGLVSLLNGYRHIYSGWRLPKRPRDCSKKEIEEHYKSLSAKYAYEIPVPDYAK